MRLFDRKRVGSLFAVLGDAAGRGLLHSFADNLPGEMRTLCALAAQRDLRETERHAHGLKGAAANFGAVHLQAASRKVEAAAHALIAPRALDQLLAELERVAHRTSSAARRL